MGGALKGFFFFYVIEEGIRKGCGEGRFSFEVKGRGGKNTAPKTATRAEGE